jgi:hypothetical protein
VIGQFEVAIEMGESCLGLCGVVPLPGSYLDHDSNNDKRRPIVKSTGHRCETCEGRGKGREGDSRVPR